MKARRVRWIVRCDFAEKVKQALATAPVCRARQAPERRIFPQKGTIRVQKRNIYILYALALLQGMVFYGPVATLYRQAQGVTIFQITLIESISYLLCILLEVPWGVVADRIGYKKTMVICAWLYFLSKIIFWQASGFGGFLAERVLLSVVVTGLSGVDTSILYLCAGPDHSQRVFGIYNSLGMAGLLTASAVFTFFVGDNYRLAALLTVLSYGAAAILCLGLTEVRPADSHRARREPFVTTLRTTLAVPGLLGFLVAVGLLTETHQTVTVFLNQLQYERCGMGSAAIGGVYIAATLLGLCGVWSARLTGKTGTRGAAVLFCAVPALACALLASTDRALLSVGGIWLLRLSDTLFQPFQVRLQSEQVRTDNRATALSIHAMVLDVVAILTNLSFGALAERDLRLAFGFGVGICAAALALLLRWRRLRTRPMNG